MFDKTSTKPFSLVTATAIVALAVGTSVFAVFSTTPISGQSCAYGYGYDGFGYGYGYECSLASGGGSSSSGSSGSSTDSSNNSGSSSNTDTSEEETETTGSNECTGTLENGNWYRMCTMSTSLSTFADLHNNVACEGFFVANNGQQEAARKEVAGVAVKMRRAGTEGTGTNPFSDVGLAGESSWIKPVVLKALSEQIITANNPRFRPHDTTTRAEAYAMIMAAVCLYPTGPSEDSWQAKLHRVALAEGLTVRDFASFSPNAPILRQELFALSARAADWAEETGGCNPKPEACLAQS